MAGGSDQGVREEVIGEGTQGCRAFCSRCSGGWLSSDLLRNGLRCWLSREWGAGAVPFACCRLIGVSTALLGCGGDHCWGRFIPGSRLFFLAAAPALSSAGGGFRPVLLGSGFWVRFRSNRLCRQELIQGPVGWIAD